MKRIGNVVVIEFRKAFVSKKFLLGAALLLIFSMLSAVYMIESRAGYNPTSIMESMKDGELTRNPTLSLITFYNSWVGGDELSLAAALFYTLLPVGAALPFGWSYYVERKKGYLKNIYSRVDKKTYLTGKAIAVFLSGAAVVAISLVVNILLVLARIPLITPFVWYNLYNHVYFGSLWSDLYFSTPELYILLFALLDVVYGGVFALFSFAVGFYFRNILAVLFSPFLFMVAANYVESVIQSRMSGRVPVEFVPTQFLHPQGSTYRIMGWAVVLVTALLLGFSIVTIYFRGVRHETL